MYRTNVQHYDESRSIADYAKEEIQNLNCSSVLRKRESVLGRDHIIYRTYNDQDGLPIDVTSDYCDLLAVDRLSFNNLPSQTINHGLPSIAIDVIRRLRLMREPVERINHFSTSCLTSPLMDGMTYTILSNDEYEVRMKQFEDDNEWVRQIYFLSCSFPMFPSSRKYFATNSHTGAKEKVRCAIRAINDYFIQSYGNIPEAIRHHIELHS